MPSFYKKLLKNFEHLSRSLHAVPRIPSEEDREILKRLEKLRVNDPFNSSYNIEARSPLICGATPERIVVEVREHQKMHFLTYWYFWSYDRFPSDHEDWEPVTLVYKEDKLARVDARIHDALISYTPQIDNTRPKVHFYRIGHTPIIKVKDIDHDILLNRLNDNLDYTRKKWLELCYQRAESDGWKVCDPPKLESRKGPMLDEIFWGKWGKHSIYLRV
jgi:hypothetical protein